MEQSRPLLNDFELAGQHDGEFHDEYVEKTTLRPKLSPIQYVRVCWGLVLSCLIWLLPRYRPRQPREKKLHVTSYLDALRGLAAVGVVNSHTFMFKGAWIMQRPIFRASWSGTGMVDIFFVISGYVLSYRMIKMMRTGQTTQLLDTLASATFRRYLRLYCSAAVASFLGFLSIRFVAYHDNLPQTPFFPALGKWIRDTVDFGNPYVHLSGVFERDDTFQTPYLLPLWTIPVEFRGSMLVFTFCAMSCKLSTKGRMILCWLLVLLSYYWWAVYGALFLLGIFLADLSFSRHPERLQPAVRIPPGPNSPLPKHTAPEQERRGKIINGFLSISACIIGLTLVGLPIHRIFANPKGPWPYPFLVEHIPSYYGKTATAAHWWISIGSVMLVWGLDSFPVLQIPLTWSFPQYLGDLSFGIYVMHITVNKTLMHGLISPMRGKYLGDSILAKLPEQVFYYLAVLWAADMFTRVDTKVVNFGRWLQLKTFKSGDS